VDPGRAATLLCRKITQRLPSFGEAFTQQVPLTRIRDIAHRGDIPHVSLPEGGRDGLCWALTRELAGGKGGLVWALTCIRHGG
jgi:hypothetical protein